MDIVVILVVFGVFFAIVVSQRYTRNKKLDMWRTFASRRNGRFEKKDHWLGLSQDVGEVTYRVDDFDFKLDLKVAKNGRSEEVYTRLRAQVHRRQRLEIISSTFVIRLASALKKNAVKTGYADFDERFMVYSSHPTWARLLLSRSDAWRAYQLGASSIVCVYFENMHLAIEHEHTIETLEELEAFASFAREVAGHILETEPPLLGSEAEGRLTLSAPEDHEGALTVTRAGGGELTEHED